MFKKIIIISLSTVLLIGCISACKEETPAASSAPSEASSPFTEAPGSSINSMPDYYKDKMDDKELESQIKSDYLIYLNKEYSEDWKLEDIWIQEYFGNYSGCEVVYMGCPLVYAEAFRDVEIGEYTITFPSSQEVYAYKDSNFYTLKEAYDAGLITADDVYNIGKHKGLKIEVKIDDEKLADKIKSDYLIYLNKEYSGYWRIGNIWIQEYFGNYSGCEVVYMGYPMDYTDAERRVEIEKYTITFPSSQEVYAYKDSNFYTLKEAYDAGLITADDVYNIGKHKGLRIEE